MVEIGGSGVIGFLGIMGSTCGKQSKGVVLNLNQGELEFDSESSPSYGQG